VKKLLIAACLLGLAASASAQGRHNFGPPACAQCITPQNPTPGVPAGATSFTGFTAFNPPPSTSFTAFNPPPQYGVFSPSFRSNGIFTANFGRHGHHHRNAVIVPYGYAYPVYVPAYLEAQPEPEPQPVADVPSGNAMDREMMSRAAERMDQESAAERDRAAAANTDPRYGEHYLDGRDPGKSPAAAIPAAALEDNEPALVLVMLDGSRVQLANYAIVGKTIYDLGHRGKKIQIAEVDLAATHKANDTLGLDVKLPSR
jgi:hypothetical protein